MDVDGPNWMCLGGKIAGGRLVLRTGVVPRVLHCGIPARFPSVSLETHQAQAYGGAIENPLNFQLFIAISEFCTT